MFSQYCNEKYTVEKCEVVQPDGTSLFYPELQYREEGLNIAKANTVIGIK